MYAITSSVQFVLRIRSSTTVRLDNLVLTRVSALVRSPMMTKGLLKTVFTATEDLADDNDPIFFHDFTLATS